MTEKEASKVANCSEGVGGTGIDIQKERLHLLSLLDRAEKLASFSRIRDPIQIKLRVESARALGYLASVRAQVIRDYTLQDVEERLTRLEALSNEKN